jgi:N-methylhydantoinase B
MELTRVKVDPGTVEIIRNALLSIAMQMKATIIRSAYSSTIQEAQDFSVALFERDRLIAQGDTMASHIGSTTTRIRAMLTKFPLDKLEHGDVILMNDPFWGGTHTPDVTTVKCIRMGRLTFLPIAFGHWSDVGGMTPGSISGGARDPFHEGLLIPPIKLYEKGRRNEAAMDIVLNNVRLPELRDGDTRTQVAACSLVEERLNELIERFGEEVLSSSIESILDATEERTRARISNIPDGVYEYEDYGDSDGISEEPIRIHLKVNVKGSDIKFDFTGTSKESAGPSNCGPAIVLAGIYGVLKMMLDPYWVMNDGFYRPIETVIPEGTCMNPARRVPTGSCMEMGHRVRDVIIGALAGRAPRNFSPGHGCVGHTFIGGIHPTTGRPYVWYEYPAGSFGGSRGNDGCSSMTTYGAGDTRDYPIERAEAEFPLLCTLYRERVDGGGPGEFRGGLGLIRNMKILDDERYQKIGVSTLWDRTKIPPFGIEGGFSGCPGRVAIIRADGRQEYVPVELGSKCSLLPLHFNDILSCRTGGGGGYGDPLERVPDLVLQDVRHEKVSELVARDIYGVVIDKDNWMVDIEATKEQREKIKRSRVFLTVIQKGEEFVGNRRIVRLNNESLNAPEPLDTSPYLIELLGSANAPLRVWAIAANQCSESEIELDKVAMKMLRIGVGDKVWVRDPNWAKKYVLPNEEER